MKTSFVTAALAVAVCLLSNAPVTSAGVSLRGDSYADTSSQVAAYERHLAAQVAMKAATTTKKPKPTKKPKTTKKTRVKKPKTTKKPKAKKPKTTKKPRAKSANKKNAVPKPSTPATTSSVTNLAKSAKKDEVKPAKNGAAGFALLSTGMVLAMAVSLV
ncbi:hypothetical protein DYB25_010957 [Aphanomyces astaci]|uniref:Uncharacterized protein n=1 Tax=Aphanomyces astaci TaxID=112090 RepID=A0A397AQ12_APHAT|nr:hypothetical protein DYB25_010957 [Aphanomyces astaci]RHY10471.1 hypothetical protein DYB36_004372 [Aphanomyces astaci]RHY66967.1 hypothetical protein DYB30_007553 [Aphanomyces astaci]RHY69399.1 hypothetical protein DYB38_008894 [Aphanomyces astaci]RHY89432.1 hypothetical protein DYB31_016085 [Aphanomyces astaci]